MTSKIILSVFFSIILMSLLSAVSMVYADEVIGTIPVGNNPAGIAANPTTNKIYVSNFNDDTVSVIDGATESVTNIIAVGDFPLAIAVNPTTNKIYVTNSNDNTVSVIDGTILIIDITPPTIGSVSDITRDATGPNGAVVNYTLPVVTDDTDPNPTISCEPSPGSLFPIGSTTVTCTAEDASGNISTASFIVTVLELPLPEATFCNGLTIDQLISSGQYNVIDNRSGSLGVTLQGTPSNDLILSSNEGNNIFGMAGNDCIIGGAGNDIIKGNAGNDIIFGNDGSDQLVGGLGNDLILGDAGDDEILGGFGNDIINGQTGADQIFGNDGNDLLVGGLGHDVILGGNGNDRISGGLGNDSIDGEAGNDTIRGQIGSDFLKGGIGDDIINGGIGADTCVSDRRDTTPAVRCEL